MFQFLRRFKRVLVLKDEEAFWRHCNARQRFGRTPDGPLAQAEYNLDLRAAELIKDLLEKEVGPEEGSNHVQMQNWDWNDDRSRAVYMLRAVFRPELLAKLQELLVGEFADFSIVIVLYETWQSKAWGHLLIEAQHVAVQSNVAQAYAIAA